MNDNGKEIHFFLLLLFVFLNIKRIGINHTLSLLDHLTSFTFLFTRTFSNLFSSQFFYYIIIFYPIKYFNITKIIQIYVIEQEKKNSSFFNFII